MDPKYPYKREARISKEEEGMEAEKDLKMTHCWLWR